MRQDFVSIDVDGDMALSDLKALLESESGLPVQKQKLMLDNVDLVGAERSLTSLGIKDGDLLLLAMEPEVSVPSTGAGVGIGGGGGGGGIDAAALAAAQNAVSARTRAPAEDVERIRQDFLTNPNSQQQLRQAFPDLVDAINDPVRWREQYEIIERQRVTEQLNRERLMQQLNNDPFNLEAQQKIEGMIQQERIGESLHNALEHHPESFGRVHMLYVPIEVNNQPIKAFVDSGAQVTTMSPACAERIGATRLIDTRYGGVARGVGVAKILGRIHTAQIKIGNLFLSCSFTVMEGKHIDVLMGLDMLKRFQAVIDLKENVLKIADESVPFLGDAEIPQDHEANIQDEPELEGADGARVGANSGTVTHPADQPPSQAQPSQSESQIPAASPAAQEQLQPRILEESIKTLTDMGFGRQEAVFALRNAGGNVETALGFLL